MGTIVIYTDGAARGNPGHSASGYSIYMNGEQVAKGAKYNGKATNNFAEYNAIILAMEWCIKSIGEHQRCDVEVYSDSELVVRQLNRLYKVKSEQMRRLNYEVRNMAALFKGVRFRKLPRSDKNIAEVDARLNLMLDRMGH